MPWKNANSSMIDRYDYDPNMRVLHLQFNSGRLVAMQDVPPEVAEQFDAAPSKGKFFHSNLRDAYRAL